MLRRIAIILFLFSFLLISCTNNKNNKPSIESSQREDKTSLPNAESDESNDTTDNIIRELPSNLIYLSDQTIYSITSGDFSPEIMAENVSFVARSPQYDQVLYLTQSDPPKLTNLHVTADLLHIEIELGVNEVITNYEWSPSGEWLFIQTSDSENFRCMVWNTYDESQVFYSLDSIPTANIKTACQGLWLIDDNLLLNSSYDNPENMIWVYSPITNEWTELETNGLIEFPLNPFSTSFQENMHNILESIGIGTLAHPNASFWGPTVDKKQDFYYETAFAGDYPCGDIELVKKPFLKRILPETIFKSLNTTNFSQIIPLDDGRLIFLRFMPSACEVENGTVQLVAVDPAIPNEFEVLAEVKDAAYSPLVTARLDISPDGEYLVWTYESADFETSNLMLTTLADSTTVKLLDVELNYTGDFIIPELVTHVFWVNE